jgi:hypothetical protein
MTKRGMIVLGLLLAGSATIGLAQSRLVGINAAIRNSVQIKPAGATAFSSARLKQRVSLGDDIQTAASSVLQILLLDKTTFTVGANARVRIDRFVYDPAKGASAVGASVAKGAFRFMSGKPTRGMPGQSNVNTPVGSIGIRGTIFEGVVGLDAARIASGESAVGRVASDAKNATLIVLRGPGGRTQGDEKVGAIDLTIDGKMVGLAQPGMALFVPGPGKAPIGPFMLSDDGLLALHALLRTTPSRRGSNAVNVDGSPIVDLILECEGFSSSSSSSTGGPIASSSSSSGGGCRSGN